MLGNSCLLLGSVCDVAHSPLAAGRKHSVFMICSYQMIVQGSDGAELNDSFLAALLHTEALLLLIARHQMVLTGSKFKYLLYNSLVGL